MAAKRKPRDGLAKRRPRPIGGGSKPKPEPIAAEPTPEPDAEQPADQSGASAVPRVLSVRSRRASFNRAGLRFINTVPTIVRESEVGPERFGRILSEPNLRIEEITEG